MTAMNRTSFRKKALVGALIFLMFAALSLGILWFYVSDYAIYDPHFAAFPSPDGAKSAYIVISGLFMGYQYGLWVSPTGSMKDARWLGILSADETLGFEELSWSKDSDLVVARCHIETSLYQWARSHAPQDASEESYMTLGDMRFSAYAYGYDFSSSTAFVPWTDLSPSVDDPGVLLAQHNALERLLVEKGGSLAAVSNVGGDPPMPPFRKMSWLDWRRCKKAMRKERK